MADMFQAALHLSMFESHARDVSHTIEVMEDAIYNLRDALKAERASVTRLKEQLAASQAREAGLGAGRARDASALAGLRAQAVAQATAQEQRLRRTAGYLMAGRQAARAQADALIPALHGLAPAHPLFAEAGPPSEDGTGYLEIHRLHDEAMAASLTHNGLPVDLNLEPSRPAG